MINWLKDLTNRFKTSVISRYKCHKKIMLLGSLYGVLTNKNEASKMELKGLLLSLNFNVSEASLQLPIALQSKIWKGSKIHEFLLTGGCNSTRVEQIIDCIPDNLRYSSNEEMSKDIKTILIYANNK